MMSALTFQLCFIFFQVSLAITADCKDLCDGDQYCYVGNCYSCSYFRQQWESQIKDFGTQIGVGNNVSAYSCQNDTQHMSELAHFLEPAETGFNQTIFVGMRFQCVHYARYYWILKYGSAFGDIDTADQIYNLKEAIDYQNGGFREIKKFQNGGKNKPQPGDLVIWNKSQPYYPYGHVAVVLEVNLDNNTPYVTIGEQNYDDIWDSQYYARKLKVSRDNFGLINIINEREVSGLQPQEKCKDYNGSANDVIIGWVRLI